MTHKIYETIRSEERAEKEEAEARLQVQKVAGFVNDRPDLLSLLYDIDLLPEQIRTMVNAIRLHGICLVWQYGERGQIEAPKEGAREFVS